MQLYVHIISQVGEVKAKSTFKKKEKAKVSKKQKSLVKAKSTKILYLSPA